MAFWNSVKRAFGFSPDDEEIDEEYDSSLPTYAADSHSQPDNNDPHTDSATTDAASQTGASNRQADDNNSSDSSESVGDPSLPGDLFDAVIKLFNDTLPDFVKECLSTEQQRRFIYNALDESLRTRLDNAVAGADNAVVQQLRNERDSMRKKIEELKLNSGRADSLSQEIKRLQLSADRQKRALCDRVNDLEHQVTALQAEKEKILTSRTNPVQAAAIQSLEKNIKEKDEEIESLKTKLQKLEADLESASQQPDNSEEIARLQSEVERQSTLREQLEVKTQMTDAMLNELRSQAAQARQDLAKANEDLAVVGEIQAQLDKFEEVKKRKDDRINELQAELDAARSELDRANERVDKAVAESDSLRRTIENNLYNQANSESRLRREIKELKQQLESTSTVPAPAPAAPVSESQSASTPKRRTRRKARVDENLDNTDWLASPGKKSDPDFGYHDPPHSPMNTNDAQLSLF